MSLAQEPSRPFILMVSVAAVLQAPRKSEWNIRKASDLECLNMVALAH
jgi:hypothetical protein